MQLFYTDISRIGDNKKAYQVEMLPEDQLLVLISGKTTKQMCMYRTVTVSGAYSSNLIG